MSVWLGSSGSKRLGGWLVLTVEKARPTTPKCSFLEGKWDPGYFREIQLGEILFQLIDSKVPAGMGYVIVPRRLSSYILL